MEIEERLKSRIEAILINDARSLDEINRMAAPEEPLDSDPFAEERNLYQRIISNYKSAVSHVNSLLEEHIEFLSGFYRMAETIKETDNFSEICARVADCILQDLRAEYCSLLFPERDGPNKTLCLEGVRENRKFVRFHSSPSLLGSEKFEELLGQLAAESGECLIYKDVYREPRFNSIDFPSVIRSLICLPIVLHNKVAGLLVLGHSRPQYFTDNHVRILRILCSSIAHLRYLTSGADKHPPAERPSDSEQSQAEQEDSFSVVVLDFEKRDEYGRAVPLGKGAVDDIRRRLSKSLRGTGTILFHDDGELLAIFQGTSAETLPRRIALIRASFGHWQEQQGEEMSTVQMNLAYAVSDGEDSLSQTLEMASLVKRPAADQDQGPPDDDR